MFSCQSFFESGRSSFLLGGIRLHGQNLCHPRLRNSRFSQKIIEFLDRGSRGSTKIPSFLGSWIPDQDLLNPD